jgi:hypothetical protein
LPALAVFGKAITPPRIAARLKAPCPKPPRNALRDTLIASFSAVSLILANMMDLLYGIVIKARGESLSG